MNKKGGFRVSVGISSLLMIFIVLALTTFAVLGFVTANSDYKLAEKTAKGVTVYYEADAAAERLIASVDRKLEQFIRSAGQLDITKKAADLPCGKLPDSTANSLNALASTGGSGVAFQLAAYEAMAMDLIRFELEKADATLVQQEWVITAEFPVDDARKLTVKLQLSQDPFGENGRFKVLERKVESMATGSPDDEILDLPK